MPIPLVFPAIGYEGENYFIRGVEFWSEPVSTREQASHGFAQ